jgi:hypothetical protein
MRRTKLRLVGATVVALTTIGAAARADDATGGTPPFGHAGELAFSTELSLAPASGVIGAVLGAALPASMLTVGGSTTSNNGGSSIGFSFAPAADYFVINNLSIGGSVLFGFYSISPSCPSGVMCQNQSNDSLTAYGFVPRIGYNIALSDLVSWWPKVYFAYEGFSINNNGGYGNGASIGLSAPFLFHVASHFFLGIGPYVGTQVMNSANGQSVDSKTTTYGAAATVGGWF